MKALRTLYMLAAATIAIFSCEKPENMDGTGELRLTVDIDSGGTKASNYTTEIASERAVQSVEYYVFDSQGRLEALLKTTGTSAVSARVSTGTKTVWAAVNIPSSRFSDVTTLSQFEAKEVSFADFGESKFPMSGKKTGVSVGTGSISLSIPVERFVSRICFAQLTNSLTGKFRVSSVKIKGVFLSNVAGNCKVTGSSPSSRLWYNKFGRKDGGGQSAVIASAGDASYPSFTYRDLNSTTVSHGAAYDGSVCLYFFPNPATSDVTGWSSSFSQRYTRLVAVLEIEGETYYYPVNLAGTLRNHAYTLYLTVTHLGTKDPDTFDFVEIQDVSISIGGFDEWDEDLEVTY